MSATFGLLPAPAALEPRRTKVCPDCGERVALPLKTFVVDFKGALGHVQFIECTSCAVGSPLVEWNLATQAKGGGA